MSAAVAPLAAITADQIPEKPIDDLIERQDDILKGTSPPIDAAAERRLVRKLDFWIIPIMMITYLLQSWDKGILSSATQFGILTDLDLSTVIGHEKNGTPITNNKKYSNTSFIFYIGYLVGTYPMMFLAQKYTPSKVLGIATLIWGAIVMSTAGVTTYTGMMLNRVFLGVMESAVAPGFTVLVTFWWTRDEQALRTSLWYSCVGLATTFSPLVNYGLGRIHTHLLPWKPLFLILGGITVAWSFVIIFFLPDSPLTSKRLNEEERRIAIDRLERNRAGTVNHHVDRAQIYEALTDYKVWSSALIILLTGVPSGALGTFGTVVINGFGYDHFQSLALTCPIGAITFTTVIVLGVINRYFKNSRYISIVITVLISITGTIICWAGAEKLHRGVLYFGVLLIAVQVGAGGLAVTQAASNIAGHTTYCIGNCIGPVIFGASPGPIYHAGFEGSTICLALVIVTAIVTYLLLRRENARRDKLNDGGVITHHIDEDLSDKQNKEFRYVL